VFQRIAKFDELSDSIKMPPNNGVEASSTHDVEFAALKIEGETTYAIQYHPEVFHLLMDPKCCENLGRK
jgi:GMP synthase (glutamine-hydrolysing)